MIDIKTDADGIALLTIDMPGRAMNVIDWHFIQALRDCIDSVAADASVKSVIVTSGKTSFIAGADLSIMKDFVREGVTPRQAADLIGTIGNTLRRLETLGKPVVGASTGTALGGGLELLLACHYRVAADTAGALYGTPEVKLGLLPGAGGTQRLPRLIGIAKALPLMLEGNSLSTAQALALGLLDEVVPAADLLENARRALREGRVNPVAPWDRKGFRMPGGDASLPALADTFSSANGLIFGRTHGLQPAPKAIVTCVYEGSRLPMDRALRIEQMVFAQLVQGTAAQGMIRTLFFARQAADKLTFRPKAIPTSKVVRLGVVGAGFMGQGIAQVSAVAGIDVVLIDRDADTAEGARAAVEAALRDECASGRLSQDRCQQAIARITAGADFSALRGCSLVIEAVPEVRQLKAAVLRDAHEVLGADVVFATNTSALALSGPTGLDQAAPHPQNFIGLHFFSPVARMALVEIVVAPRTSPATLARAMDYVRQIKRTPIVVNDAPGFYTTRCVEAYLCEGLRLLAEGQDAVEIDTAAVSAGMAVGPLALADEVGLDVLHHVRQQARAATHAAPAVATRPDLADALIDALHAAARCGRKAAAGVYAYDGARRSRWSGLPTLVTAAGGALPLPEGARSPQPALAERLLAVQLLTAAAAFGQGIVQDAGQADLGAVLGWAFPSHLGGPLAAIDDEGAARFAQRMTALAALHGPRFEPPPVVLRLAQTQARFHSA
jgi:3-hydroxyacyl-CoA dehydrogenase / enoyl-CoA hydratase / 3-hydroxybutyryl-CoA epimerase